MENGHLIHLRESFCLGGSLEALHESIHDLVIYNNGNCIFSFHFRESVCLDGILEPVCKMIH